MKQVGHLDICVMQNVPEKTPTPSIINAQITQMYGMCSNLSANALFVT